MGEFNSGASEVSSPILNTAGIAQDSPANTYVGLTASLKGVTAPGEPAKYMPSGKHTYTRIVPIDTIQGAADLLALKETGCTKLAVFDDTQAYGAGLEAVLKDEASMYGMSVVYVGSDASVEANYTSVASKIASSGAQCVELSATTSSVGGDRLCHGRAQRPAQGNNPRTGRHVLVGVDDQLPGPLHRRDAGPEGLPGRPQIPRRLQEGLPRRQSGSVFDLRLRVR